MEKTCSTTLSLTAHPLQTQVINGSYHATKSEDGCTHFTRLAVAALLLPLPNLTTIWNHNSIDSATFKLSAMPLDLSIHLSTCRMEQDLSSFIKIFFKIQRPLQLQRKNNADEKCDRACFFTKKSLIMFYCLLLEKQEVILFRPMMKNLMILK